MGLYLILVLNTFLSVLAIVLALYVYLDRKGERKTIPGTDAVILALQRQVAGQDEQIGYLTRALALLVPADARPTGPHHPIVGLSRPSVPSPEQVAMARTAHAERRTAYGAPIDQEGDRGGIIPGDPIPAESPEDIRVRFEAKAEARSRARAGLPSMGTDDEPVDERTHVYSGKVRAQRPTLLGGLAGAPLERPRSGPKRAAAEYKPRRPSPSSPTLVSPGIVPPTAPNGAVEETDEDGAMTVHAQHEDGRPLADRPEDDEDERGTPSPPKSPRER